MRVWLLVLLTPLSSGCTTENPAFDPGDGEVDACDPGTFLACADPLTATVCRDDGSGGTSVSCAPYPCNAVAGRCDSCWPQDPPRCAENTAVRCVDGAQQTEQCEHCFDGRCLECQQVVFYADADGDEAGDGRTTVEACTAPRGFVDNGDDCDDGDGDAHPGQLLFFRRPRLGEGGYDFNCDEVEEKQSPSDARCQRSGNACTGAGWLDEVPDCGDFGQFVTCVRADRGCVPGAVQQRQQACR